MKIKNIFLVDDDQFFAATFIKNIQKRGDYEVEHFQSFEEALHKMPESNPELILIEQNLKGKSGLEAIPHIQKQNPDCDIIMVSDQNDISVVESAYQKGVSKYFRKDILLLDHIEGLIREKQSSMAPWKKLFA